MMQMPRDQVIRVVTVRYGFMAAACPVLMVGLVRTAVVFGRARRRVGAVHRQRVIVVMVCMHMVQVTVVQIIDMAVVLDGFVPAPRRVPVCIVPVMMVLA